MFLFLFLLREGWHRNEADSFVCQGFAFVAGYLEGASENPQGSVLCRLHKFAFEGEGQSSVQDDSYGSEGMFLFGVFGRGFVVEQEFGVVLSHRLCADEDGIDLSHEAVSVDAGFVAADEGACCGTRA